MHETSTQVESSTPAHVLHSHTGGGQEKEQESHEVTTQTSGALVGMETKGDIGREVESRTSADDLTVLAVGPTDIVQTRLDTRGTVVHGMNAKGQPTSVGGAARLNRAEQEADHVRL